jgi:hypothetical protein
MRWVMIAIVAAFLLSTFLMYDTGSRGGGSGERREDYPVAEVNGRRLMRSALDGMVYSFLDSQGSVASPDMPMIYRVVFERYVIETQAAQEVRDRGIEVSDAEAERAMKDYADRAFPTREAFYQSLQRRGIKVEDYVKDVARQIANQRLVEQGIGTISVSDDEALKFYEDTKDLFFRRAPGFMVNLADFSDREEAEKLRVALLGGASWDVAVSGDAVDRSKVINVTTSPVFVPDASFEAGGSLEAMASDDLHAVSSVFELSSGDFVVGVKTEAVAERVSPYDEVSADIKSLVMRQKERDALSAFSQSLLDRAKVVILDKELLPDETPVLQPVSEVGSADASADKS